MVRRFFFKKRLLTSSPFDSPQCQTDKKSSSQFRRSRNFLVQSGTRLLDTMIEKNKKHPFAAKTFLKILSKRNAVLQGIIH